MHHLRFRPYPTWAVYPADGPHGEAVGVACDRRDRVYVFLRGPQPVRVHEPDGTFVGGWGEGLFVRPHGLTIGPDDTVYCTDDFGHAVHAFTPEGRLLFTLGTPGSPSDTGATSVDYRNIRRAAGPFCYPTNLAVAPGGDFYVSDGYGNARVHRFAPDGRLIASWGEPGGGPGQFHLPHGIAVDPDGTVVVADRENSRVQFFTPEGGYLREWADVARPCQVFIAGGRYHVAELGFHAGRWPGTGDPEPGATGGRVSVFDRAGTLLARWGGFNAPHDLWLDSRGGLYVAEVVRSTGGPASAPTLQKFVRETP